MKHGLLLVVSAFIALSAHAQIPSGYYDNAEGLTGSELKDTLNNIIDGHTEYTYAQVWDILKQADYKDGSPDSVVCFYTGWTRHGDDEYASGDGYTREHVWAKSHGAFGTSKGPGTDVHNLRPVDDDVNTKKNSRWFDDGGTEYIDTDGYEGDGSTDCYYNDTNWSWEPRDAVKGDVARSLFYMVVRYEGENGEPDCELIDYFPTNDNDPDPEHALLSTLLAWHLADPVDDFERRRHDTVAVYQENRNPFIDHPEWVCEIWGGTCTSVGAEVWISEYVEGSSYNKAIEIYNGTGASINLADYTLKKQSNGAGSWSSGYTLSGTLAAGDVYVVCHSSATQALLDSSDASTSNTALNFNGNDPIGLFYDGDLIDIVGTFDGGSGDFAANTTLVRKSTVELSSTTYDSNDWDSYSSDTFSYLQSHDGPAAASDLFISEYVEGSSYNKAIEIYNGTGSSVDLSAYSLKKQSNGAGSWSSGLALSGTLAAGEVYIVAHSSSGTAIDAVDDLRTSSSVVNFNGNDPIGLFNGSTLIDIVGTFDGGSGDFAANTTLVRKSSVTDPTDTYDSGEWDSYSSDTFTYLDAHTYGGGSTPTGSISDLYISEYIEGSSYNKAIELYNTSAYSVDLSGAELKKNSNGGSTWSSGLALSGTIASGDVYVIAHSSAASGITDEADLETSSSVMNFNGNDPIGLFDGSTLIDVVGTFNGGSSDFAANTTLVRKSSVSEANTTYTVAEWDSYSNDTFTYLGAHTASKAGAFESPSNRAFGLVEQVYPNPFSDALSIVFTNNSNATAIIYDLAGKPVVIEQLSSKASNHNLNVAELPAGVYLLEVTAEGAREVFRIVKH